MTRFNELQERYDAQTPEEGTDPADWLETNTGRDWMEGEAKAVMMFGACRIAGQIRDFTDQYNERGQALLVERLGLGEGADDSLPMLARWETLLRMFTNIALDGEDGLLMANLEAILGERDERGNTALHTIAEEIVGEHADEQVAWEDEQGRNEPLYDSFDDHVDLPPIPF